MSTYLAEYKSYWRFAIVGCSNTAVDFIVFTVLREFFQVNYLWCQVAGFILGIVNSFVLNKTWTFESQTSKLQTSLQFSKFIGVNGISLVVSLLGLKLLSGLWQIDVYMAKVIVTGVAMTINYLGYRFWVFENER